MLNTILKIPKMIRQINEERWLSAEREFNKHSHETFLIVSITDKGWTHVLTRPNGPGTSPFREIWEFKTFVWNVVHSESIKELSLY